MTEKIDEKLVRDSLARILKTGTFTHSQVYQDLLIYLVEASIRNSPPKEFAIATEVFHKGQDFDPSRDTIVRVYIYNLRKKLEHYYQHEGKDDKIHIQIPKGHYGVEFIRNNQSQVKRNWQTNWLFIPMVLLLGANLVFAYLLFLQPNNNRQQTIIHSAIWQNFVSNGIPKQIVLGDHFFFVKDSHDRDKRLILRRDDVNSIQEFQDYRAASIDRRNYVQLRYPMFPKNSVWPMADLVALVSGSQADYALQYCSNVKASDFQEKDMLFVGSFHTLGAFEQTFRNSRFQFHVYPNGLSYKDEDVDTLITLHEVGDPVFNHIDYGVARKIPAPDHKTIFIFTSFHETGTHGIVKYFTEPETLAELESLFMEQFSHIPDYYEILFQASGYNRTVYTTKIEKIFEINADSVFW